MVISERLSLSFFEVALVNILGDWLNLFRAFIGPNETKSFIG